MPLTEKIAALTLIVLLTGCNTSTPVTDVAHWEARTDAFEADELLGQKVQVLVTPMIEDEAALKLRSKATGLEPSSLKAKSYGLRIYVAYTTTEVGSAALSRVQIYHLGSDKIIVDERYIYGDGYVSPNIIKIRDKTWSGYYKASQAQLAQLDSFAEAVRNGTGHKEAYKATGIFGSLDLSGAEMQNVAEREVTWVEGVQELEGIAFSLKQSHAFGNQLVTQFVRQSK